MVGVQGPVRGSRSCRNEFMRVGAPSSRGVNQRSFRQGGVFGWVFRENCGSVRSGEQAGQEKEEHMQIHGGEEHLASGTSSSLEWPNMRVQTIGREVPGVTYCQPPWAAF